MLKPLTQEQIDRILEVASSRFADKGLTGANINHIARDAGVSVGVIYKYYGDKEGLFSACVQRCLDYLDQVFARTLEKGGTLMEMIEDLIVQNQEAARRHPEYFRLYHQITVSGASQQRPAELIEGRSAEMYRKILQAAQEKGEVRADMDPSLFAFFFDNLMMMLHFSYACRYYEDRFRVYCGEDVTSEDEFVRNQMMRFLEGALYGTYTGV